MDQLVCPNCGTQSEGDFCSVCGQPQGELIPSVRAWVSEAFDELLLVEARLPRTLRTLAWPPGGLTAEWWRGRRAAYVSPLRLYLLAAIPFFLVFTSSTREDGRLSFLGLVATIPLFDEEQPTLGPQGPAVSSDSIVRADWQREFERRAVFNDSVARILDQRIDAGVRRVFNLLPIGVGLTMVPLLALLLAFGTRPPMRFIARLIFSLHLHTVAYAVALLGALLGVAFYFGTLGSGLYLAAARRHALHESWVRAIGVAAVTVVLYGGAFLIVYISFVQLMGAVAPGWIYGV